MIASGIQYMAYKHEDATEHDSRYPLYIGPWNQNVRSLS